MSTPSSKRYALVLAFITPVAATLLRMPLNAELGASAPFLFYFPTVMFVAWYGGLRAGLCATAVSFVLVHLFIIPPLGAIELRTAGDWIRSASFIAFAGLMSLLAGQLHSAIAREAAEKQRFEVTLRSIGDAVITAGADGKITLMNAEAERLTGWKAVEAKGRGIDEVFRIVHASTGKPIDGPVAKVLAEKRAVDLSNHTVLLSRDGREYPIDDSAAPIWMDASGGVSGVILVFKDVTERYQARRALEKHAQELEQNVEDRTRHLREALQDMESFSYSVSHDLRAPLRTIQSFAEMIMEEHGKDIPPAAAEYVGRIRAGVGRLDALTQDLLRFARVSSTEIPSQRTDLKKAVEEALGTVTRNQKVGVSINIPETERWVLAHPSFLQQALQNLYENAIKFVRPGTTPEVVITAQPSNGFVRLSVSDNGIGIDPAYQAKIFKVFQRLEPDKYEGTGLGLAVVERAILKMNGRVGLRSQLGKGSTFWIELQRCA